MTLCRGLAIPCALCFMHVASLGVAGAQLALRGTGAPQLEEGCRTPSRQGENQGVSVRRKVVETLRRDREQGETAAGGAFSGPGHSCSRARGLPAAASRLESWLSVALATGCPGSGNYNEKASCK